MAEERNNYQIARKDAKNCFVESLNDSFPIGRVHFAFATYDVNRPAGQRQTNNIHIYIYFIHTYSLLLIFHRVQVARFWQEIPNSFYSLLTSAQSISEKYL